MDIQTIDISRVIVPTDRFREANPKKVEDIAASMLKFKQLQPIIIDSEYKLVDGLHRLTACKENGATTIDAVFRDEADDYFLREMELEANIQRQEITWQERERAIATLHALRKARDPNWTQAQTQAVVGAARQGDVSQAVQLTKMMEIFPEIGKAKSKNQALAWMKAKAKNVTRVLEVKNTPPDLTYLQDKIVLGDSVEVIKTIPDESFHAIITDPPFGINYDNRTADQVGSMTAYKDDEENYWRLLSMAPDMYRVLKPNGWVVWFLGMTWYERAKLAFRGAGFTVDELPIFWDRSEGRTFTVQPRHYFGRGYDIALHMFKGDPAIVQTGKSNVIRMAPVSTNEKEMLVERPVALYSDLIQKLTLPNEIVADFFVGSGSCPAAAAQLGRDFFGVEQSPERRAFALEKIVNYVPKA